MKTLNLRDILTFIGRHKFHEGTYPLIEHVTTAPKNFAKNTLYIDLKKNKIDLGRRHKAPAVIITEKPSHFSNELRHTAVVEVNNVQKAYWNFVRHYRSLFNIPVIGVTGTCGKTTTVEMIKTILKSKYITQATYAGRNGQSYNLPYLLGIDDKTEAAVFELAVGAPGCITTSCAYLQPQVGVLLNIGVYHLQWCDMDNYIKAKAEILEGMGNRGQLIINADDENIKKIDFSKFRGEIIKISLVQTAHYSSGNISYDKNGIRFDLIHNGSRYPVYIQGYGEHNVYNALAAIAATHAIGIPIPETIAPLATFQQLRRHLQFCQGINGSTIIDDTWNCNPTSTNAALDVLTDMVDDKKKIAVIGYMPRLGQKGKGEYLKVGERVAKLDLDCLVLIGQETKDIGVKASEMGMDKNRIYYCNTGYEVFNALHPLLDAKTLVLFKFPYKSRLSRITSFQQLMEKVIIS